MHYGYNVAYYSACYQSSQGPSHVAVGARVPEVLFLKEVNRISEQGVE